MNFTFGIITDGSCDSRVNEIIATIKGQMDEKDEILTVCEVNRYYPGAWNIISGEERGSWITRKKNLIAQNAKNDNLVILHDYIKFAPNWRHDWLAFGEDWDYAMNVILDEQGQRYRDWCAWDDPAYGHPWTCYDAWCPDGYEFKGRPCIVPYSYNKTQYMYVSGAYFLIKRQVLLDNPFDENLLWGMGEDVEHSLRIRNKYKYVMNKNAIVHLMKPKDKVLPYVDLT